MLVLGDINEKEIKDEYCFYKNYIYDITGRNIYKEFFFSKIKNIEKEEEILKKYLKYFNKVS